MAGYAAPMLPRTVPGLLALIWRQSWVRLLVYILLGVLALWLARLLSGVIVTALLAYALAFLVNPLLHWLEERRVPRALGVALLLLVLLGLLFLLSWTLLAQLQALLVELPALARALGDLIGHLLDRLSRVPGLEGLPQRLDSYLTEQAQQFSQRLGPLTQRLLAAGGGLLGGVVSAVGWLGQAAFVVTLALYFMLDYRRVGPSLLRLFPRRWQPTVERLSGDVSESFGAYIRGKLLIALAIGTFTALGLLLLGVPDALALGLITAALDFLPYIGLVIAAVPAALLALPGGWLKVALVLALYVVANQLEGNLLTPFVMGRSADLSAAAVLLALLAGLALFGLPGALLAVPVAILLKRWTETYWMPSRAHQTPPGPPE